MGTSARTLRMSRIPCWLIISRPQANWSVSLTSPIYWREENVRIDYKLGKTWNIMGRYTQDHWNQASPSTLGYWGDDNYPSVDPNWIQPGYQATVKLTKLLGNTAVNDFQVSYA